MLKQSDKPAEIDSILIWDKIGMPDASSNTTVLWASFGEDGQSEVVSIPKRVEEEAAHYRNLLLAWIFELGELSFNGKKIIEHLEIQKGFSYWWLTRISEKCNFTKSPQLENAIKLIAFDELFCNKKVNRVRLVSPNKLLSGCLRAWCESGGIEFRWDKQNKLKPEARLTNLFPKSICAITWLIQHVIKRIPLRNVGVFALKNTKNKLTIISYSANMNQDSKNNGQFKSNYWSRLPQVLHENDINLNWLHIFVKDGVLQNANEAAESMRKFNEESPRGDVHTFIDSFIGIRVVLKTLIGWVKLILMSWGLRKVLSKHKCSTVSLWPLVKDDWNQSIYGKDALQNLLFLNLFDRALLMLPQQNVGVYLQENQGWELGMLHVWNKLKKGDIYGFPHSTVRDWDLRYFFDPRCYSSDGTCSLPCPTGIAVNGQVLRDTLLNSGYPSKKLIEVEALRYLHLFQTGTTTQKKQNEKTILKLLVFGGYLTSNTDRQLQLLNEAMDQLKLKLDVTLKPHPLCDINTSLYPNIAIRLTKRPIEELLQCCDVVYTDCITSAGVDAFCMGVPVISELNPSSLNLSPLRGRKNVLFVRNSEELVSAIRSINNNTSQNTESQDFFYIDPALPRWKKLLLDKMKS